MSSPLNIRKPPPAPFDNDVTPIPSHRSGMTGTPPVVGASELRLLRAQYSGTPPPPNIPIRGPPRAASPTTSLAPLGQGNVSRSVGSFPGTPRSVESGSRASASGVDLENLPDEEKAKVIARHLVSRQDRVQSGTGDSTPTGTPSNAVPAGDSELFPISYDAPGADITHDIYKWHSAQQKQVQSRVRSVSFTGPSATGTPHPAFEHIHEPGGFRRNYLLLRADEEDFEPTFVNNFIDFLFIFGHFAGEDLEEDSDEEEKDEASALERQPTTAISTGFTDLGESTPLLSQNRISARSRSRLRRSRRSASEGPHGTATVTQAVLMLLKAFIGTGVLFLGKAFYNGGILFSAGLFVFIAAVSLWSFLLLVNTKYIVPGSFGDIGGTLYGPWMRYLILGSIVVSQIGFVGAYIIFVSENLQAFVMGVTGCRQLIPIPFFILVQTLVFLPLSLIRDLAKLSTTALIADGFILVGLVYIFGSEFSILAHQGIQDVKLFNPRDFSLFVGTAVFSFEGIGLVIPITDSMREPHKFPAAITGVMFFLTFLFGGAGALAYLTFGDKIQTVILINLNLQSKMVQTVQFLYSLAIMLSEPLQLFPAIRIMENGLFSSRHSGKGNPRVKWMKNMFRFAVVFVAAFISWVGAADLDKFVALVGCFACVPLCYVYPAMLHYRACAYNRKKKIADITMIIFGLFAAAYTTIQTVKLIMAPSEEVPPPFGCQSP
ncbi:hypothetical protein FISHEDRAFT_76685 [Fistulina hepatica ATCC 64428]|uniref:Amino acid transporter transmembrane domain-containing protein n=1 Tax=Fistulina hepatica ATCC 64428 TaxID=1128425 RepID=A0A0D7A3Y1_9AGAR|nr:hypothetical protein FISHEDRAFT_76685 [Fistulina hepatica ATCC 64428]